jgi:hypothetical protein
MEVREDKLVVVVVVVVGVVILVYTDCTVQIVQITLVLRDLHDNTT